MGSWCIPVFLIVVLSLLAAQGKGPFDWQGYDTFDEITDKYDSVNAENCRAKPSHELRLPKEVLAQLPRFNKLLSTIVYPNRTNLLHLHNMALNRAFFFSYAMQKLNASEWFYMQPGLMYYYFSTAADISANEWNINGSAVMYDNNCTYANWYRNLPFNKTLPLFGPRAWRYDDYNEPTNWIREPTNRTINLEDYGAGSQSNYSHKSYKINEWYDLWLPDGWDMQKFDSVRKHTYDVGIKYSNETGKFYSDEYLGKTFFGPPSPGQKEAEHLPVKFTAPYFDCGRSNKWIVSAVSPVVDQLPRYLEWFHLRRHRFVASVVMDIDYLNIDINPCPLGIGNEPPNHFQATARCKDTTMCEPLYGWGYRRGGYRCVCQPGFRYPPWQKGPFQGIDIESATEQEYKDGFDCKPVQLRQVIPVIRGNDTGTPTYNVGGAGKRKRRHVKVPRKVTIDGIRTSLQLTPFQKKRHWKRVHQKEAEWKNKQERHKKQGFKSRIQSAKLRLFKLLGLREDTGKVVLQNMRWPKNKHVRKTLEEMEHIKQESEHKKTKFHSRYKRAAGIKYFDHYRNMRSGSFNSESYERMMTILNHKERINKDTCKNFLPEDLELPGDVAYNVEYVFSPQARTALRTAHFLSNFLQNIDMYEEYGNLRGDNLLNIELLFGEALANVMGDLKIKGSGIFYDIDKFEGPDGERRQFFGPYAYRYEASDIGGPAADRANTHFRAIDYAGLPDHYLDEPWFKNIKERWQSNTYGLAKFTEKPMIRSDLRGSSLRRFELYPLYYFAPNETDGWWSAPYFDCDGYVNDWVITYSVPFFGLNSIGSAIEFKGVVVVDIKLDELDIDQCPADFHVANAFKNTGRCDYISTYCEPLPGKKFYRGNYKCECRQGFEYPFNDRAWYFDGQTIEEEYRKLLEGKVSRYHTLKCRISGSTKQAISIFCITFFTVLSYVLNT